MKGINLRILLIILSGCFIGFVLTSVGYLISQTPFGLISANHNDSHFVIRKSSLIGNITSAENNLGIIKVRFNSSKKLEGKLIFRVKNKDSSEWFHQSEIPAHHVNTIPFYSFGFPVISDSKGKIFEYEITHKSDSLDSSVIALSDQLPHIQSQYVFPKTFLINATDIIKFLGSKIYYYTQSAKFLEIAAKYFLVFILSIPILALWQRLSHSVKPARYLHYLRGINTPLLCTSIIWALIDVIFIPIYLEVIVVAFILCYIYASFIYKQHYYLSLIIAIFLLIQSLVFASLDLQSLAEKLSIWSYLYIIVGLIQSIFHLPSDIHGVITTSAKKIHTNMVKIVKVVFKRHIYDMSLILLILLGFLFRFVGISQNHSFWSDEALISAFASEIATGNIPVIEGMMKIPYQPLQILITSISLRFLGTSEFAARLPSVLTGTIGIYVAFLLGKRLSSNLGGLIAAFAYTFLQVNLANATQAKPYTTLQTLLLLIIFLLVSKSDNKRLSIFRHGSVILLLLLSTYVHYLGVTFWFMYMSYIGIAYKDFILRILKKPLVMISLLVAAGYMFYLLGIISSIMQIITPSAGKFILITDNTMHFKNLFGRQYLFLFIPFITVSFWLYKDLLYKSIISGILVWSCIIIFMWNFRLSSHSIRYLLPFFGILIVFFGIFCGQLAQRYFKKQSALIPLLVACILMIMSGKFVAIPHSYYSPNADFYGDVQTANYKNLYKELIYKYPNYEELFIVNNLHDAEAWYLGRYSNVYFMKGIDHPIYNPIAKVKVYGSLEQFKSIVNNQPRGLLIVEDWESILPEDIKQYAKENMKLEYRVESLEVSPTDKWPIEIYSWGMEE